MRNASKTWLQKSIWRRIARMVLLNNEGEAHNVQVIESTSTKGLRFEYFHQHMVNPAFYPCGARKWVSRVFILQYRATDTSCRFISAVQLPKPPTWINKLALTNRDCLHAWLISLSTSLQQSPMSILRKLVDLHQPTCTCQVHDSYGAAKTWLALKIKIACLFASVHACMFQELKTALMPL